MTTTGWAFISETTDHYVRPSNSEDCLCWIYRWECGKYSEIESVLYSFSTVPWAVRWSTILFIFVRILLIFIYNLLGGIHHYYLEKKYSARRGSLITCSERKLNEEISFPWNSSYANEYRMKCIEKYSRFFLAFGLSVNVCGRRCTQSTLISTR